MISITFNRTINSFRSNLFSDISNGDRLAWLDRVLKEQVRLMPGQRITTALVEQPVSSCAECAIALEVRVEMRLKSFGSLLAGKF